MPFGNFNQSFIEDKQINDLKISLNNIQLNISHIIEKDSLFQYWTITNNREYSIFTSSYRNANQPQNESLVLGKNIYVNVGGKSMMNGEALDFETSLLEITPGNSVNFKVLVPNNFYSEKPDVRKLSEYNLNIHFDYLGFNFQEKIKSPLPPRPILLTEYFEYMETIDIRGSKYFGLFR